MTDPNDPAETIDSHPLIAEVTPAPEDTRARAEKLAEEIAAKHAEAKAPKKPRAAKKAAPAPKVEAAPAPLEAPVALTPPAETAGDVPTLEAVEPTPEVESAGEPADSDDDDGDAADDEPAPRQGIRALSTEQLIALRRAQVDDEVIDSLPDGALIALAKRFAAIETRNKEHYESLKGEQPRTEGKQREETEGVQASPPTPEPAPQVAPRSLPEPVRVSLGLDDSEVEALEKWRADGIAAAEQRILAQAETRSLAAEKVVQELQSRVERNNALAEQQIASQIRADLKAEWPEVAAPEVWAKVWETARQLAPGYKSDDLNASMQRLLYDSTFRVVGPPLSKKPNAAAQSETARRGAERVTPQLTRPGRKTSPAPRRMSEREKAEALAVEIQRKHGLLRR